jgi:hypothetical protein
MRSGEDPTNGIEIVSSDLENSDYVIAGQKLRWVKDELVLLPKTETQILKEVRHSLPIHYWMLQDGYNDRKPVDAWELVVGGETTPLYNYAEGLTLREEQVQKITVHLAQFAMCFTEYYSTPAAITITDHLSENVTRDGLFKRHAEAQPLAEMFALTPRSLEAGIYRPDFPIERLGAVVLHELGHFGLDTALQKNWPKDPITSYAERFGKQEDIPESAVAYMLYPAKLSIEKKEILSQYDHWRRRPDMMYHHVPDMPAPEAPDVIRYYVDEEAVEGVPKQ